MDSGHGVLSQNIWIVSLKNVAAPMLNQRYAMKYDEISVVHIVQGQTKWPEMAKFLKYARICAVK
jgi:hypothetical protein